MVNLMHPSHKAVGCPVIGCTACKHQLFLNKRKKDRAMDRMQKLITLSNFTSEELKREIERRKTVERAKKNLITAEEGLSKAKAKVDLFKNVLEENEKLGKHQHVNDD